MMKKQKRKEERNEERKQGKQLDEGPMEHGEGSEAEKEGEANRKEVEQPRSIEEVIVAF